MILVNYWWVQGCVCEFYLHEYLWLVVLLSSFVVRFGFIVYGLLLATLDNELIIVWFEVYVGVGCDFINT